MAPSSLGTRQTRCYHLQKVEGAGLFPFSYQLCGKFDSNFCEMSTTFEIYLKIALSSRSLDLREILNKSEKKLLKFFVKILTGFGTAENGPSTP